MFLQIVEVHKFMEALQFSGAEFGKKNIIFHFLVNLNNCYSYATEHSDSNQGLLKKRLAFVMYSALLSLTNYLLEIEYIFYLTLSVFYVVTRCLLCLLSLITWATKRQGELYNGLC